MKTYGTQFTKGISALKGPDILNMQVNPLRGWIPLVGSTFPRLKTGAINSPAPSAGSGQALRAGRRFDQRPNQSPDRKGGGNPSRDREGAGKGAGAATESRRAGCRGFVNPRNAHETWRKTAEKPMAQIPCRGYPL